MTYSGARIHITGIVQGVGFRPFVFTLAKRFGLTGWVRNSSAGVEIQVDGPPEALKSFAVALRMEAPPLARVDSLEISTVPSDGFTTFEIIHSEAIEGAFIPISPDVSICPDCLKELFDPTDRRYFYPFINCTNCGPRFTIIEEIPYDRPNTTMKDFPLCPECAAEYQDPTHRRFHAQPVACPVCGPHIWLERAGSDAPLSSNTTAATLPAAAAVVQAAQKLVSEGKILAIKGLGGFHLACDATHREAVAELRRRKLRVDKPFALMMPDLATVEAYCYLNEAERALLLTHQRPIVLLHRRSGSPIVPEVAPGQDTLGVMLPYTPLHYLLLAGEGGEAKGPVPAAGGHLLSPVWVMTSGNLSEEPIAIDNAEARQRLSGLCDAFLMHNRPIRTRCDDSVVRATPPAAARRQKTTLALPMVMLRRSRGYAPDPIALPIETPPLLAAGAELKNTFCLSRERYAFLSHHIGDLENYETLQSYQDGITHFERLFHITPQAIAYDLHPNYLATRYALERAEAEGVPAIGIQHHHAHIAACMADNRLIGYRPLIGIAFDGTGYGTDGAIWGGEFLVADYKSCQRLAHLAYTPLPGGDAATRKPARIALASLWQAGLEWNSRLAPVQALSAEEQQTLRHILEKKINTPSTSSIGRLFDAAAALTGIRQQVNYEAQAAIEFEAVVDPNEHGSYPFEILRPGGREDLSEDSPALVAATPLFAALVEDLNRRALPPTIAARFHNGVAEMVRQVAVLIRQQTNINEVALSGGVWQNITLLQKVTKLLRNSNFTVFIHHQVPSNDGGLALGQAMIASCSLLKS